MAQVWLRETRRDSRHTPGIIYASLVVIGVVIAMMSVVGAVGWL
jgi:hypothetical protein